jgi:hypothetical protein
VAALIAWSGALHTTQPHRPRGEDTSL